MLREELAACCKALKLGSSLVENSCLVSAPTHEEYLLKLLKLEVEHRTLTRRDRLLKNAGFYSLKTLSDYKFNEVKLPSGLELHHFKDLSFVGDKRNLILYGNVVSVKPCTPPRPFAPLPSELSGTLRGQITPPQLYFQEDSYAICVHI